MSRAGLGAHLRDAIRLNRSRRSGYRLRGGWRADLASRLLVSAEAALLPVAHVLDRQAARHPEVPILRAELSDMENAPPPDRPIRSLPPPGRAPPPRGQILRSIRRALREDDLAEAARGVRVLLTAVGQAERADRRRRPLAVHVVESAGLMAERGAGYARQSGGATLALSRRLIWGHLVILPFAAALDRLAAPVHRRGIGLFVNDLPPIPFAPDD